MIKVKGFNLFTLVEIIIIYYFLYFIGSYFFRERLSDIFRYQAFLPLPLLIGFIHYIIYCLIKKDIIIKRIDIKWIKK